MVGQASVDLIAATETIYLKLVSATVKLNMASAPRLHLLPYGTYLDMQKTTCSLSDLAPDVPCPIVLSSLVLLPLVDAVVDSDTKLNGLFTAFLPHTSSLSLNFKPLE
jgi:hypothetical protein